LTIPLALRIACFGAALVALLDAALIFASLLIADRAPVSAQAWTVSLIVIAGFLLFATLCGGIGRQAGRLGALAPAIEGAAAAGLRGALVKLGWLLLGAALACGAVLLLVGTAILARIDEGFAVFG
jgi:hypothetical protein